MGNMKINPKGNGLSGITIWWMSCNSLFNCGNCLKANVGAGRGEVMLKMDNTAMVNPSVSSLFIFRSPYL
ncbi:hypothetical protein ACOSP7_022205 [Xanthoceras sorbifolium]